MTWVAPPTYTVGELLTAALMNDVSSDLREVWREIGYTQFTSTVNCTATSEATANQIVSAGALTFDGNVALIEFWCPWGEVDTIVRGFFALYDGSSSIGILGRMIVNATGLADDETPGVTLRRELMPSAGSHTYSVRGYLSSAGTLIVGAGAGASGNPMPGFIRILQKGG